MITIGVDRNIIAILTITIENPYISNLTYLNLLVSVHLLSVITLKL